MAFTLINERVADTMKKYASRSGTKEFFKIDIGKMIDSWECDDALQGVTVTDAGIIFNIGYLVTNEELEKSLGLHGQELDLVPARAQLLTRGMLTKLGYQNLARESDASIISCRMSTGDLSHDAGLKFWVTRMQERVFFNKGNFHTAASLQVLWQIQEQPSQFLALWKLQMLEFARKKPALLSTFNLMMGYVLRHSSYKDLHHESVRGPPSAMRSVILRNASAVRDKFRSTHGILDAAALEEKTRRTEYAVGGGSSGYRELWLTDLLERAVDPPANSAYGDLICQLRQGVAMGMSEVNRSTIELQSKDRKIKELEDKVEETVLQLVLEKSNVTAANVSKSEVESTLVEVHSALQNSETLTATLQASLAKSESEKEKLAEDLKELEANPTVPPKEIERYTDELARKDEEVRISEAVVKRYQAELAEKAEEVSTLEAELKRYESDLATKAEDVLRLETKLNISLVEVDHWKGQTLSQEYLRKATCTPEENQAMLSVKKRKILSTGGFSSEDEFVQIVEEVERRVKVDMEVELGQLRAYQRLVQQAAREQFSLAPAMMDPSKVSVDGYYQVMNLLVDSYRVAMGIPDTELTNLQWLELLRDMPMEGREAIPRMLFEQRLTAINPEACNVLLGGLLNLHVCHLMSAQNWCMSEPNKPVAVVELSGQPLTEEEIHEFEEQAHVVREHLSERRSGWEEFLSRLERRKVEGNERIAAMRMRQAFGEIGWDRKEEWQTPLLSKLRVPKWAIDYKECPSPLATFNMDCCAQQ